jgi:hypothetical protein
MTGRVINIAKDDGSTFFLPPKNSEHTQYFECYYANKSLIYSFSGLLYSSVFDCMSKVYRKEGGLAFFKGWTACYFRLGPYTILLLVFWDKLKHYNTEWSTSR